MRLVGGDISEADRKRVFGNASFAYVGGELGIELQVSNVILTSELSALAPGASGDDRAPGLSGVQFGSTLTFLLPWTVAGAPKSEANTPKASEEREQRLREKAKALQNQSTGPVRDTARPAEGGSPTPSDAR